MPLNRQEIFGGHNQIPVLRPDRHWIRTGLVKPGETGPGCAVNCIYCNQTAMDVDPETGDRTASYLSAGVDGGLSINSRLYVGDRLDRYIPHKVLLEEIKKWPLYTPNSPVILENFNDPGNDWLATAGLATGLVRELGHESAIAFITKMGIKPREVVALKAAQLGGANLIGIITYSNLPQAIEPSSSRVRLNTIKRLSEAGIPVVVSMRPIIKGLNDSPENIDLVLRQVAPYADIIIAGGLFVFEQFTIDAFAKAGYPLDSSYSDQIYAPEKVMRDGFKELARSRAEALGIPVTVQNHTSCAISEIMTRFYSTPTSDRFAHWIRPRGLQFNDDCAHCPPDQKALCEADAQQDVEQVIQKAKLALERLGYPDLEIVESIDVPNTILVKDAVLLFDELTAIKESCRWFVDNLPNYEGMKLRINGALESDMHLVPRDHMIDIMLIGQEWHVIVKQGDLSNADIELMEKWIRSRSRHRARIITIESIQNGNLQEMMDQVIANSRNLQDPEDLKSKINALFAL